MSASITEDANDLLHWLNAHSVSISDGIPVTLIQQKWVATRRTHEQLKTSLEWLFGNGMVAMTPDLMPPHVRLSALGFQKLLMATDSARAPVPTVMPMPAAPTPQAAPLPRPPAIAAAPATPIAEPALPKRFVDPAKPPTEIGLRNQILAIFRDLRLVAGQQLIAMTLTRYWQEMGQRGEHLRIGIDVMLRDGYLEHNVKRYENYWLLTPVAHAYLSAPISAPTLLALAQPMTEIAESDTDEALQRKTLALFKATPSQSFKALAAGWPLDRDALIHALDLLCKSGELHISDEAAARFTKRH